MLLSSNELDMLILQHGKDGIIYGKKAECVVRFVTELGGNDGINE